MAVSQTLHFLLILFVAATFAEIEIVSGPGVNSTLVCNESWVAWENNTRPFYALLGPKIIVIPVNETVNVTLQLYAIRVLQDSFPIIPIEYFEEGENGTRGRPVICRNPPKPEPPNLAFFVVVYVASSFAIIASVVALLTYSLLEKLRTLPGLVIMNLFLAFLLGDIILQIRIGLEWNGKRFIENVALNQGLLLARFLWMTLTGFEMCRTLYRGIRLIGDSRFFQKWTLLSIYMIIGWGTAIVLTIIMYSVEKSSASTRIKEVFGLIGYLTYYVPIALSLLINIGIVMFISVIFFNAARRQRRLKSSTSKKQNINFLRLFLILLTVLGLVWILFFALQTTKLSKNNGVIITYAILTATQPIFVCIAFVCTPTVYRMYLVRFQIRKQDGFPSISRRHGTVTSMMSEREFQRGRTMMSLVSEREFKCIPPFERKSSPLQTIKEQDEDDTEENPERPDSLALGEREQPAVNEELDTSAVSNSTTVTGVPNGTTVTAVSNGTTVVAAVNDLPVSNGFISPTNSRASDGSLNPDREETNV